MQYKTFTIKNARNNFAEIIERAAIGGEFFLITKFGKSKAVIAPFETFDTNIKSDNVYKKRQIILKETAGAWKKRKDIKDPIVWSKKLRKLQSNRYGKVFS